jgi:hypothetical protein
MFIALDLQHLINNREIAMRNILATLALACASLGAYAATPSPQSIEKLLSLTQAEKMLDSMKAQLDKPIQLTQKNAMKGRPPSPEEQKVLNKFSANANKIIGNAMTMERFKPLYIKHYGQVFSQEEVDGMIAFYQSPAGKAMVTKMPQLMQSLMDATPEMLTPMNDQIRQAAQDMATELEAMGKAGK